MIARLRTSTSAAFMLAASLSVVSAQQPLTPLPVPPIPGAADGSRELRTSAVTTVVGSAWNADNQPLAGANLRLRSVSSGRVVADTAANESGEFSFSGMETDSYVTELVDQNGDVLAVGDAFAIDSGQTVVTFVRAPQRGRQGGGAGFLAGGMPFGWGTVATAALGAAAGAGVMALRSCDCAAVSPEK